MTPLAWVALSAAGAIGAPLRYLVDRAIQNRTQGAFPWGTLVVNTTGSFLFGVLTGLALHRGLDETPTQILGAGFCGAYTTFSTFSYETLQLIEERALTEALRNLAATLLIGVAAAASGFALTSL